MAYDRFALFDRVREALASAPHTSLSTMAQRLRVERHTIERTVQSLARKTFREFRAEALAAKALKLLTSGRSIKEVAFLVGYRSPRGFSRFIRRAFGAAPTDVRRFRSRKPRQHPRRSRDCRRAR